jgi:hypothetical protein
MKKISLFLAIIVLIAVIGFGFAACESLGSIFPSSVSGGGRAASTVNSPFVGIWLHTERNFSREYIFDGDTYVTIENGRETTKGEYTYTDTRLALKVTHRKPDRDGEWVPTDANQPFNYTISGDTLTLGGDSYTRMQVSSALVPLQAAQLVGAWVGTGNNSSKSLILMADGTGKDLLLFSTFAWSIEGSTFTRDGLELTATLHDDTLTLLWNWQVDSVYNRGTAVQLAQFEKDFAAGLAMRYAPTPVEAQYAVIAGSWRSGNDTMVLNRDGTGSLRMGTTSAQIRWRGYDRNEIALYPTDSDRSVYGFYFSLSGNTLTANDSGYGTTKQWTKQ